MIQLVSGTRLAKKMQGVVLKPTIIFKVFGLLQRLVEEMKAFSELHRDDTIRRWTAATQKSFLLNQ